MTIPMHDEWYVGAYSAQPLAGAQETQNYTPSRCSQTFRNMPLNWYQQCPPNSISPNSSQRVAGSQTAGRGIQVGSEDMRRHVQGSVNRN